MNKYHTVIIGSGPAGYSAALELAAAGRPVCLIDKSKEYLGGTCLNAGCIPTKSFLESANFYQKAKTAVNFAVEAKVKSPDLKKIKAKAVNDVALLKKSLLSLLESKKVHLEFGRASFLSADKVEVEKENGCKEVKAENFIIAAGSKAKGLPDLNAGFENIFNSDRLCKDLPQAKNVLIVGGGYIGCEFAQFYNSLGSEVTIIDIAESLLPGQDKDVVRFLEKNFSKKGIKILTSKSISSGWIKKFSIIIVAVGRKPSTDKLNLERAGVELESAFIKVDNNFKTTADNIYAVGDLINTPMLAHVAFAEGRHAADFILGNKPGAIDYNLVPEVIFSQPQVASFGLKEYQAQEQGVKIEIKKKFFKANPKAQISGDASGFAKLIFNKNNKKLIGASIIGPEATELIHILTAFAGKGAIKEEIEKSIYAHPALAEIFAL